MLSKLKSYIARRLIEWARKQYHIVTPRKYPIDNIYLQWTEDDEQRAIVYTLAVPYEPAFTKIPKSDDMEILNEEPSSIAEKLLQLSVLASLTEQKPPTLH